jgi:hypothetical protein
MNTQRQFKQILQDRKRIGNETERKGEKRINEMETLPLSKKHKM